MRSHIDLFTGIGGFSLACQWNGIETVVMCEKDERCRQFLERTYPEIPIVEDIRDFDGTRWTDAFILTAGVPCQPASRAGKQGGKGDDRWLWDEALRVVEEARPTWCIFENPPGLEDLFEYGISLEVDIEGNAVGEVGTVVDRVGRGIFVQTLEEIEQIGYSIEIHELPACAVNSPQRRARVWILAHRNEGEHRGGQGQDRKGDKVSGEYREALCSGMFSGASQINLAHATEQRLERAGSECREETRQQLPPELSQGDTADTESHNQQYDTEPCTGRENKVGGRIPNGGGGLQAGIDSINSDVADAGTKGYQDVQLRGTLQKSGRSAHDTITECAQISNFWSSYLWTPCADTKLRRTPFGFVSLAHGLPVELLEELGKEGRQTPEECRVTRQLLAALGNSIVWPVAAEIIKAMKEADNA